MPNVTQYQNTPTNAPSGQGADTTNLGFNGLSGQNQWGDAGVLNRFNAGNAAAAPGAGTLPGTGFNLQQLVQRQLAGNDASRAANQGNWNSASSNLMKYTTPFTPDVIANMQNSNAMKAQAGTNNAFSQQAGILAAGGQGDASSLAAASAQTNRTGLGAQIGANTQLGIQAALGNNQAGFNVGNSIISHLPQNRPDDLSGLMALQNNVNNQNNQNSILQNQFNRPLSPGMTARTNGPIGAGDTTATGPGGANAGAGAGFGLNNPQAPNGAQGGLGAPNPFNSAVTNPASTNMWAKYYGAPA